MPPNDWPSTTGFSIPSAWQRPCTSSPHWASVQVSRLAAGAAVAAVVDVEHLVGVGEAVEVGPQRRVVEAGPAVHDDQRRPLDHPLAVRDQLRPHHVEKMRAPLTSMCMPGALLLRLPVSKCRTLTRPWRGGGGVG